MMGKLRVYLSEERSFVTYMNTSNAWYERSRFERPLLLADLLRGHIYQRLFRQVEEFRTSTQGGPLYIRQILTRHSLPYRGAYL